MTSYGLLTYLLRGEEKLGDAVSIAKWLLRQRNSMGGFMSSQDTVMGVTALAKFAEAINTKENLEADVKVVLSYGKRENSHTFHIGKDNRTVLQEYLLPGNTTGVTIKGRGKGTALAQLTWTYYVEAVDLSPAFSLKAKLVERDQGRNLDMEIEFYYNRTGKSNMAILEARTPSGYAFDQEELESLKQDQIFKRYELEDKDSKLQLYFESVGKEVQVLNLKAYRIYMVAKHAQGVVKIYDYYDNTQTAQFMYDVPAISLCDICNADKSCALKECKEGKEDSESTDTVEPKAVIPSGSIDSIQSMPEI
jgi:CD109 antigen